MEKRKEAAKIDVLAIRKKTGLNQLQFWSRLGVTQSGGSRYESGRVMPKPARTLFDMVYVLSEAKAIGNLQAMRDMAPKAKATKAKASKG